MENFIARIENFDIREKTTGKESKTLKEIKKSYKICRCVYNSVYKSIAENF